MRKGGQQYLYLDEACKQRLPVMYCAGELLPSGWSTVPTSFCGSLLQDHQDRHGLILHLFNIWAPMVGCPFVV